MEGVMYTDAPVANLIRASGEPGDMVVTVQSPNLESASVTIHATAAGDKTAGITEPALPKAAGEPVAKNPQYNLTMVTNIHPVIRETFDEFHLPGKTKGE